MSVTTELLLKAQHRPASLTDAERRILEESAKRRQFASYKPCLVMSASDFTHSQIKQVMSALQDAQVEGCYVLQDDYYSELGIKIPAGSGVLLK